MHKRLFISLALVTQGLYDVPSWEVTIIYTFTLHRTTNLCKDTHDYTSSV